MLFYEKLQCKYMLFSIFSYLSYLSITCSASPNFS